MTIQDKIGIIYAISDCSGRSCDNCAATNVCRGGKRAFVIDLINEVKLLSKSEMRQLLNLPPSKKNPKIKQYKIITERK